jgi:predicted O-methyltransferase YrrM
MKTMSDRAKAFLNQFEKLSQCPDPRSFGRDGSNQYYSLLYSVAKELQPRQVVELGTCTGGSTSHLAAGPPGKVLSIDIEIRPDAKERLLTFDNIELLQGDTLDEGLGRWLGQERGPIELLFIDTLNTA